MENIEIINGVPVNWSKYKGNDKKRPKNSYIGLCELLYKNGHTLESDYINTNTKALINFNCNHEPSWIYVKHYKNGVKCKECGYVKMGNIKKNKAKEDFINLVKQNGHELLSEYTSALDKVLINFNCNHEPSWIVPSSYKNGVRCPKCAGNCTEQAKEDFLSMLKENGHTLMSEYINAKEKVLINFNCNHEPNWIAPYAYKDGNRCPKCRHKGESVLYELLIKMGYKVESQKMYEDLRDKRLLSYDFYLPEYNLLIELDGEHHRKIKFYKSKDNITDMDEIDAYLKLCDRQYKDKLKDDYAISNNIPLLRIEYNSKIELDKWKQLILDKINEIKTKIV